MEVKKKATKVIALDEPETLRDRLECKEWAMTESIKVMREIGAKDIALLAGLAHDSLKKIDLEDAFIENLTESLFEDCESLETIKLPQCSTLPSKLFKSCKNLKEIIIHPQVSAIEDNVFEDCVQLESLDIPQNISKIGEFAFFNCMNLKKIVCHAQYPPICGSKTFEGLDTNCAITVSKANYGNYKNSNVWKHLKLTEE